MSYIVQNQTLGRSFNIAYCGTYEEAKKLFEGRKETRRRLYPTYQDIGCPTILQVIESDEYNIALEMNKEALVKRFHEGEITEVEYKEQIKKFPSLIPKVDEDV